MSEDAKTDGGRTRDGPRVCDIEIGDRTDAAMGSRYGPGIVHAGYAIAFDAFDVGTDAAPAVDVDDTISELDAGHSGRRDRSAGSDVVSKAVVGQGAEARVIGTGAFDRGAVVVHAASARSTIANGAITSASADT